MRQQKLMVLVVCALALVLGLPATSRGTDFAAPKGYPVGTAPAFIVTGDFNGDGKIDIAVGNAGSNDVSILLGNGDGTFKAAVNSPAGLSPQQMAVGDFNGDGKLDLVVINSGDGAAILGSISLLLGKGDGTFQAPATIAADKYPAQLAVADFNEDKKLDLIVGDLMDGGVTLLPGKGDGTFQAGTVILPSTVGVSAMTVGDFNGDKHVDLVVGTPVAGFRSTDLGLSLLPGKGDGTFQTAVSVGVLGPSGTGQTTVSVFSPHFLAADINGDGKLDLVVKYAVHTNTRPPCGILTTPCGDRFFNDIDTFLGNGDTTFAGGGPVSRFGGTLHGNGGNLGAGDFNADGKLDLVTPLFGTGVLEWGLGDGTFRANLVNAWTGLGPFVAVAELNGAAPPDLIVTDPANNAIAVIVNHSQTSGTDLAVILSQPPPATPIEGVDFSYRATVLNEGPQDGTGVAVKETLPSGLKLVSVTPSQGSCVGTTTITCDLGAMADVSAVTIDFTVTPVAGGTFTDALQVAGSQADLNSKNDTASFTVTVLVPADISVSGSSSVTTAATGDKVTYTLQVANAGPNPATNVVLTDSISDGSLVVSALTSSQGNCTPTPGNITCAIGAMNSGAKVNISFVLTMGPSEIVGNGVTLTSDTLDTNTDNNNLVLNVNVNPADLTVGQIASVTTANVGTQVKFTINVKNNGPAQATNVVLNDNVPAGATIGSVQASQGTCPAPAVSGLMSCTLGSLAAAASATVSFVATPTAGGTMTNSATVNSDQVDPASSDNSTRLDVPVQDFSITPAAQSLTVARGGSGSEVLTFAGQGGFTGNLDLKCSVSGQAPMPTCGLTPTTVAAGGTSTLTINAASLSASLVQAPNSFHFGGGVFALCLPLGIFGLIITGKSSKNRRGLWLLCALVIAVALLPTACGGGTGGPPPTQSFTVIITATSVPSGVQHMTSIAVTVQ